MVLTVTSITQTCTQLTSGTLGTNLMIVVTGITPGTATTYYLKDSSGQIKASDTLTSSVDAQNPVTYDIGIPITLINDSQYTFQVTNPTDGSITSTFIAAKCNSPPCMTIDEITPTFDKLVSCGLINQHMSDSFIAMFTRILESC